MRLIEIPDDGIVRTPIMDGESIVGERRINLSDFPTVDAVPVVRCRDCKCLSVWNGKNIYAVCPKTNTVFLQFGLDTRTHSCGYGERKENNDG